MAIKPFFIDRFEIKKYKEKEIIVVKRRIEKMKLFSFLRRKKNPRPKEERSEEPELGYVIIKDHYQVFGPNSGVKLLDIVTGNQKYQYVELPSSWKVPNPAGSFSHDIVDSNGRKRADFQVAYVGGKYVNALWPLNRFQVGYLQVEGLLIGCVRDGGKLIYTTESIKFLPDGTIHGTDAIDAEDRAREWLNKNHPDWQKPGAYWD